MEAEIPQALTLLLVRYDFPAKVFSARRGLGIWFCPPVLVSCLDVAALSRRFVLDSALETLSVLLGRSES